MFGINRFFTLNKHMTLNLITFEQKLNEILLQLYVPAQRLSFDESMNKFTGKDYNKRKVPKKPAKEGIFCYLLVDENGFILNLDWEFRFKQEHVHQVDRMKKITELLVQNYDGLFEIYADNAFGSLEAAKYMNENGIGFVLCTKKKSKGTTAVWTFLHSILVEKGEADQLEYGDGVSEPKILAVSFKDKAKSPVNFLTNLIGINNEDGERVFVNENREIPQVVSIYNQNMNNVDSVDQAIAPHRSVMRNFTGLSCRLKAMFYYIANNARVAFCLDHAVDMTTMPFRKFLECIIEEITGITIADATAVLSQDKTTFPHYPEIVEHSKECYLCKKEGNSHYTRFFCPICAKSLCLTKERYCFRLWHSSDQFERAIAEQEALLQQKESVQITFEDEFVQFLSPQEEIEKEIDEENDYVDEESQIVEDNDDAED